MKGLCSVLPTLLCLWLGCGAIVWDHFVGLSGCLEEHCVKYEILKRNDAEWQGSNGVALSENAKMTRTCGRDDTARARICMHNEVTSEVVLIASTSAATVS